MPTNKENSESPIICPHCQGTFVPQVRSTVIEDDLQNRFTVLAVICEDCHKVISAQAYPMME